MASFTTSTAHWLDISSLPLQSSHNGGSCQDQTREATPSTSITTPLQGARVVEMTLVTESEGLPSPMRLSCFDCPTTQRGGRGAAPGWDR